jgi:phosphatidylglycerol:prolipoprotein diacylglycerol transferase
MLGLAFLVTIYLASKRASIFNIPEEAVSNLIILFLVSGVIGARIAYVLANMSDFAGRPLQILMISKGGLIFYGGFILASIAGVIFAKIRNLAILDTADIIAPFIALGHAIGRVGCFLNGCCFGRPTDSFLGVRFPHTFAKVYPTQLFSSAGLLIIFFFLLFFQSRRSFKGEIISLYLILYGIFRFFIEFLRGDLLPVFHGLTSTQLVSIIFVIVGTILFAFTKYSAPARKDR